MEEMEPAAGSLWAEDERAGVGEARSQHVESCAGGLLEGRSSLIVDKRLGAEGRTDECVGLDVEHAARSIDEASSRIDPQVAAASPGCNASVQERARVDGLLVCSAYHQRRATRHGGGAGLALGATSPGERPAGRN